MDTVIILDFGSQYSQLIARRIREARVYCEILRFDADPATVLALSPKAYILSGGARSVYETEAPILPNYVLASGVPVLGICYGMQLLALTLGGRVSASENGEYGRSEVQVVTRSQLMPKKLAALKFDAWMSHGDMVTDTPPGFSIIATSENCPITAMEDAERRIYALQFHPEVTHTEHGDDILGAFLDVAAVRRDWTTDSIAKRSVESIRRQIGGGRAIAAVSGGVDSTVASALVQRAIGKQLTCFYVDTGLMRTGETEQVVGAFAPHLHTHFEVVNAGQEFIQALDGVTDPEAKRQIVGEKFIRVFEREARRLGIDSEFLVQGTIYPDVVESSGKGQEHADRIKTHHNVGGLPDDLTFELVEPLRHLFKDEVRAVGQEIGLPEAMIWRQPFPGPGLAIRCLGAVTWERLKKLRAADSIMREELKTAAMLRGNTAQAFAVLLPVKSVGVMGDARTYEEVVALRVVTTNDFMTADWARLPYEILARISSRISNEVQGVNRVVYDISSKPPSTIEWE